MSGKPSAASSGGSKGSGKQPAASSGVSKGEESKLSNKLKNLFGFGGGKGASVPVSQLQKPQQVFIFTPEIDKEIRPGSPLNHRLKVIKELCDVVHTKRLETNCVEVLCDRTQDLLGPKASADERKLVLKFRLNLIRGQYHELGMMRAYLFKEIKNHTELEDLPHRLDLFKALSDDGRNLELFEDETGPFLVEWMRDIISSHKISCFLQLLVNVIKYNAAYIDEGHICDFILHVCMIATRTSLESDVELCLKLLDTVVCYSYLPPDSLHQVILCLCQVVNIDKFTMDTWMLMRKLLGTHLGHSGVYTMCRILQDKSNITESGALLMRGSIRFLCKACWDVNKLSSIKHPISSVVLSFHQALRNNSHRLVLNEIAVCINLLIEQNAKDIQRMLWNTILDITQDLLAQIQVVHDTTVATHTHKLLSSIEQLHSKGNFNGDPETLFSIVESCAHTRHESSIMALIQHKARNISPAQDNWISALNQMMDKYFKSDERPAVRLKMLDVLMNAIGTSQHLYEDDMIEKVLVPYLSHLDTEQDNVVVHKSLDLLVKVATTSQSPLCLDVIDIIKKVLYKPVPLSAPSSPIPGSQPGQDYTRRMQDTASAAAHGIVTVFRAKLYLLPGTHALKTFELMVQLVQSHYDPNHVVLHTSHIRLAILDCLMDLKADNLHRLGLPDKTKPGTIYSPYIVCDYRGEFPETSDTSGTASPVPMVTQGGVVQCKTTVLPYQCVFQCLRMCLEQEMDWTVLKMVLEKLPLVLQNKRLILTSTPFEIQEFCRRLCVMVSDKNPGLPQKLVNAPPKFSKSDFHSYIFPVLACLVSYHLHIDKQLQGDLVNCMGFGLVSKCSTLCVRALTTIALEMQDVMMRQLRAVLIKLSQISATVTMAIPLMEFLSSLIHLPQLYSNFVEEQYMSIFAISLPYTNPFKYSHYVVSLAYHVISMWFLKCRLPFRKAFVGFIVKGLQSNVLRQFEETALQRLRNQDSADRNRTQSLNDEAMRSPETSPRDPQSRTRAAAVLAKNRASMGGMEHHMPPLDETQSTFHKELTETCIDMMARYTFTTYSGMPARSKASEFLLEGGQSQSWLLGNKIITVTTSGGAQVTKSGLCEKCLNLARAVSSKSEPQQPEKTGRRRHKSAAVRPTRSEPIPLPPQSQDDLLLLSQSPRDEPALPFATKSDTSLFQDSVSIDSAGSRGSPAVDTSLDTRMEKMNAMDSVLMSLKPKSSEKPGLTINMCNCWCTQWAEVHIRCPTGNIAWMMRIQNQQDLAESFPDFPLADVSNLFMGGADKVDSSMLISQKIDSSSLGEKDYESLHDKHFNPDSEDAFTQAMLCSTPTKPLIEITADSVDNLQPTEEVKSILSKENLDVENGMRKTASSPELLPSQYDTAAPQQSLDTGSGNSHVSFTDVRRVPTDKPPLSPILKHVAENRKVSELKASSDTSLKTTGTGSHESLVLDTKSNSSDDISRPRGHTISSIPEENGTALHHTPSRNSLTGLTDAAKTSSFPDSPKPHKKQVKILTPPASGGGKEMQTHGGINPGFLFLQLFHHNVFGKSEMRPVLLPQVDVVERSMKMLDLIYPYETHKIGLLYVGPKQVDNETAILSNMFGSTRYMKFIQSLGTLRRLRDCDPNMVYVGGLDLTGNDGEYAYSWHDEFMQVIYHCATLMPNKEKDPNCNAKKLHIGNDYVSIVYNDSKDEYQLGTIRGQFNYVNIIVCPLDHDTNAVTVQTKPEIQDIVGHSDTKIISDENLGLLVRQMAVHSDLASTIFQKYQQNPKDPYASNWLERLRQIKRIRTKVAMETRRPDNTDPSNAIPEDFTDYI